MKTISNKRIRALRVILDQTQTEFAVTVGVSKDTVASWETGRNNVSKKFGRRIALVAGVSEKSLLKGDGKLRPMNPNRKDYNLEEFESHQKICWGKTAEESVRRQMRPCADALELLFTAAARAQKGKGPSRLPGVLDSFIQWCKETGEDFELGRGIDEQLEQRKRTESFNKSYGQWRAMVKEGPSMARQFKFKDDPKKKDEEMLSLSLETVPIWTPGWDMRGK